MPTTSTTSASTCGCRPGGKAVLVATGPRGASSGREQATRNAPGRSPGSLRPGSGSTAGSRSWNFDAGNPVEPPARRGYPQNRSFCLTRRAKSSAVGQIFTIGRVPDSALRAKSPDAGQDFSNAGAPGSAARAESSDVGQVFINGRATGSAARAISSGDGEIYCGGPGRRTQPCGVRSAPRPGAIFRYEAGRRRTPTDAKADMDPDEHSPASAFASYRGQQRLDLGALAAGTAIGQNAPRCSPARTHSPSDRAPRRRTARLRRTAARQEITWARQPF